MELLGLILIVIVITSIVVILAGSIKEKTETLYFKDMSLKVLRITELQDIIASPHLSEKLRNAAKDEIDFRIKNGQL